MPCKLFAYPGLIAILLAFVPFAQAGTPPTQPGEQSLVDATCTEVMGLKKGEYDFAQCRESLAHALAARLEGQNMAVAYDECAHQGLTAASPAFATCMLDAKAAASAPPSFRLAYAGEPGTEAGKSYYEVSPTVRWNRERYSCAQLGILPGSRLFAQCLTGLDGALMPNMN